MINELSPKTQTITINKPKDQVVFIDQTTSKDVAVATSVLRGEKGEPGTSLQYEWVGSRLGIKTETEENFQYVDLVAASGDISYVHDQIAVSKEWRIFHNLGKHPSVTVVDSAGSVVVGDISYVNEQELIVSFVSEFSGKAFLN